MSFSKPDDLGVEAGATAKRGTDPSVITAELQVANVAAMNEVDIDRVDYQILEVLGQGRFGKIYRARQKLMSRDVAIKVLHKDVPNDVEKQEFFAEALILSKLSHPSMLPIYELGQTQDGSVFYSMQLLHCIQWSKKIKALKLTENLGILLKVCDAIAFAHSKNVVHLNVCPEEINLGPYGEVILSGWDIAVDLSVEQKIKFGGYPTYMAPEMAQHQFEAVGKPTDIYSLGAVLFEILTGYAPHGGKTPQECLAAAAKNLLTTHDKNLPLMQVALRAMETQTLERYATAQEFKLCLEQAIQKTSLTPATKDAISSDEIGTTDGIITVSLVFALSGITLLAYLNEDPRFFWVASSIVLGLHAAMWVFSEALQPRRNEISKVVMCGAGFVLVWESLWLLASIMRKL